MGPLTTHFSWREALYLPSWNREATEADGLNEDIKSNLRLLFQKMELVREHFEAPIRVHCAYRPPEYNKLVGGARNSAHMYGMACDFSIKGLSCDEVRDRLNSEGLLEKWGLRCEDLPGSNWVHLDIKPPLSGRPRFFKP
jgi:zinc D-Ala-D-Ala carboxypeptidase